MKSSRSSHGSPLLEFSNKAEFQQNTNEKMQVQAEPHTGEPLEPLLEPETRSMLVWFTVVAVVLAYFAFQRFRENSRQRGESARLQEALTYKRDEIEQGRRQALSKYERELEGEQTSLCLMT
jgi:hypothetical protein